MRNLFFYGSLRDMELLETVLGHGLSASVMQQATLEGHAVYWAAGRSFPVLVAAPAAQAQGVLVKDLSQADMARLDFYEGGFDFDLRSCKVTSMDGKTEMAEVYFPASGRWQPGASWSLSDWRAQWGDISLQAAREAMIYFGRIPAQELARRFPAIRSRAQSYVRGVADLRAPTLGRAMTRADVTVLAQDIPYSNFFALEETDLQFCRFDGTRANPVSRAVFTGFDAAIVLPYDPVCDCVVLVEQFRIGPYARGARHPWTLEPVAGHVDLGETAETAARREVEEETGIVLRGLELISRSYPSPGCSSEYYHIFLGLCDLSAVRDGIGGLASEEEDIRRHIISFERLMELVDNGEAENGPLVLVALWLARQRDRLRSTSG